MNRILPRIIPGLLSLLLFSLFGIWLVGNRFPYFTLLLPSTAGISLVLVAETNPLAKKFLKHSAPWAVTIFFLAIFISVALNTQDPDALGNIFHRASQAGLLLGFLFSYPGWRDEDVAR